MVEKSVDQLDGYSIAPPFPTPPIERVAAARRVPLRGLSVEQLRLLIGQGEAVAYLLPLALDRLELDPFVGGDYPGDLLVTALRADAPPGRGDVKACLRAIVDRALARLEEIPAVNRAAGEIPDPDEPGEVDRRNLEPQLRAARQRLG
jgi:hypothetical protein